jgi:hypothetical protein
MRRGLYTSNYTGIPAYLMNFGFGGFLGYGRSMSCCVDDEELKMYEDVRIKMLPAERRRE